MSVSTPLTPSVTTARWPWRAAMIARISDYSQLIKPRISLMVLLTVSVGYLLAGEGSASVSPLLHAWLGIALVAAGSSSLNQWWERQTDGRMQRTRGRPLPSRRLSSTEVVLFGVTAAAAGTVYLWTCVNPLTALLTLSTLLMYVFVYTPLKPKTILCTTLGAVPGALPPVLGWVAAGRELDAGALSLFAILFLWQFPHFLAIAWLYRDDYASAGLKMLPTGLHADRIIGLVATAYALCLIPASLLPVAIHLAGGAYGLCAVTLGSIYLFAAIQFARRPERRTARGLLATSLIYLPLLLTILTWEHWRGLAWS
ncbi:MAG: heme o synthase [Planctomycetaceae bacterium]